MKNTIIQTTKVIMLGLILSVGIAWAQAWTGPTGSPPTTNAAAPINVSATSQVKNGALGVNALLVAGAEADVRSSSSSAIIRAFSGATLNSDTSNGWFGAADWFGNGTGGIGMYNGKGTNATIQIWNDNKIVVVGSGLAHTNATSQPLCITSAGQIILCGPVISTGSQIYNANGTFDAATLAPGITNFHVKVWGAGGGGGGGGGAVCCGNVAGGGAAAGGGGGYTDKNITITPNSQLTVIVGATGTAGGGGGQGNHPGTLGGNGWDSQVKLGTTVLATAGGGAGGWPGYGGTIASDGGNQNPSNGGTGETQNGGQGIMGQFIVGGDGGSSPTGGSGGSGGVDPGCNKDGNPGNGGGAPGAGGGGGSGGRTCGVLGGNHGGGNGEAGFPGRVIISW